MWQQHSRLPHCCFYSTRTRTCMPVLVCHSTHVCHSTVLSGRRCSRLCTWQQHVQKSLFKASSFVLFASLSARLWRAARCVVACWMLQQQCIAKSFCSGWLACILAFSMYTCTAAAVPSGMMLMRAAAAAFAPCTAQAASWLSAVWGSVFLLCVRWLPL